MVVRSLLALSLVLSACAIAPAPAPGPAGPAVAESQRSSNKYALDADPNTSGWTQGSGLPQGTGVQAASGVAFENTATNPKYALPGQPSSASWTGQSSAQPEAARAETAAHVEDIAPASTSFVTTDGIYFKLDGSIRYFPGSNDYFLMLRNYLSDSQVAQFFQTMAGNGIQLIRTWGFCNGELSPCDSGNSFQPTVGTFNELAFQRLDLIMSEATKNNIHIIFPFVNYWPDLGGMQWYVDQVLGNGTIGSGGYLEQFFTNPSVIQAYKNYISFILNRKNTITGVYYKDDPIIFALELANEPHTTDNYEKNLGLQPGSIVLAWVYQISAYIKGISPNHMISTGEEGYRVTGLPVAWYNDGSKGIDFDANLACPNISFATVHLYPGSWGIPARAAGPFANQFLTDRAAVAHGLNKPYILEETGLDTTTGYFPFYLDFLLAMFSAAEETDAAAIMPWELVPFHVVESTSRDGGYGFGIDSATFGAVAQMVEYQLDRTAACAGGTCPAVAPPCNCFDIPPDATYTCAQQVGFHPNCSDPSVQSFLGPGTCDISCGRCTKCTNYDYCAYCLDSPPSGSDLTCTQQVTYHPDCPSSFLGPGTCDASCGRCSPCPVEVVPECQANIEVGPTWINGQSSTEQYAKWAIYLTAPSNTTFTAPYTLSVTARAPLLSASTWNWNANVDSAGAATGVVQYNWEDLKSPSVAFVEVGGVFTGPIGTVFPQNVTINGIFCGLVGSVYYGS